MECPKCKAHNSEDAVCCTLCFENFKRKAAVPGTGGTKAGKVAFPNVRTEFEGWKANGPLVVSENGIYFFVKGMKRPADSEGTGKNLGKKIGENLGVVGYLIGSTVGGMLDDAMDDGKEGAGVYRPDKIVLEKTAALISQCQGILGDAPDIPACKEFFSFGRTEVKEIGFSFLGTLEIRTRFLYLEVSGIDEPPKLTAHLRLKGYPLKG